LVLVGKSVTVERIHGISVGLTTPDKHSQIHADNDDTTDNRQTTDQTCALSIVFILITRPWAKLAAVDAAILSVRLSLTLWYSV